MAKSRSRSRSSSRSRSRSSNSSGVSNRSVSPVNIYERDLKKKTKGLEKQYKKTVKAIADTKDEMKDVDKKSRKFNIWKYMKCRTKKCNSKSSVKISDKTQAEIDKIASPRVRKQVQLRAKETRRIRRRAMKKLNSVEKEFNGISKLFKR